MGTVSEGGGHRSPGVLDVDPASSRVVADLRHPHLTAMKSVPDARGVEPDIASGCSLAELAQATDLPLRISLRILLDVLSGIAAIHHAKHEGRPMGFVHGEVAPANIFVGRDGVARLVPLSRGLGASDANLVGYQAPELLLGDAVDQRADVFSAGVLLWEALSRSRLFRDTPVEEIVTQLIGGKVAPPSTPRDAPWASELSAVAMQAIDVDPSQRWPHVGALGATIETIAHTYLATPAELAAFVTRALGGGSRSSFSDEVTTQRRLLLDGSSAAVPESLSAVSTPVVPEPAPAIASAPVPIDLGPPIDLIAPIDLVSKPVPLSSVRPSPMDLRESTAPSEPPKGWDAGASLSGVPVPGTTSRRRWTTVSVVLAACVVLALVAAHKLKRTDGVTAGVTMLPGPELARPAEAPATATGTPPVTVTAAATAAPAVTAAAIAVTAAATAVTASSPETASPSLSAHTKPVHAPAKTAPPVVASPPQPAPAKAASPPPAAPAAPPAQKAKPAADQFGI